MLVALVLTLALSAACGQAKRPDVIIVVMDTTRSDRLGLYGYERPTTPFLAAFASEAETYERAWSTSSWTLPSHASLLTGRYVSAHGAHNAPEFAADSLGENPAHLPQSAETLAEILSRHGYRTAAFAGAGWLAPEFGLLQGYEKQDAVNLRNIRAEELNYRALEWLREAPADQPVHLLMNYFDVHGPHAPPKEFDRFSDPDAPEAAASTALLALNPATRTKEDVRDLLRRMAPQLKHASDLYDGEILYLDAQIGDFFNSLKELGRYHDALIVVSADHGEGFGEGGVVSHGAWLSESLLRIPLIVRRPGGKNGGARISAPVSITDVARIVADETGIPLPRDVNSLPVGEREIVVAEERVSELFRKPKFMDRDLDAAIVWPFKVIVSSTGDVELYDLEADPRETHNLADGEREKDLLRRLRAELASVEPPARDPEHPPMSAESRERLRALGYLE